MKKASSLLILLLNLASYSYGMGGDTHEDHLGAFEEWLASIDQDASTEREKRRREKEEDIEEPLPEAYARRPKKRRTLEPQVPLPTLRTLHEQAVLAAPASPTSTSSTSQATLEVLPDELTKHILSFVSPQEPQKLALVSKKWRDLVQAAVKHFDIFVNEITPEILKPIADRFTGVKSLYIKGSGITPQQIKLLGEKFPKLESLNLWATGMTPEHVRALTEPGIFNSLKHLNVSFNDIGDTGLELLTQAPFADNLESLDLASNQLTGNVVRVLAESGAFKSLKALSLAHNTIEIEDENSQKVPQPNAGIKFLSKTAFTRTLESLDLRATYLDGYDLNVLVDPGAFKALKKLDISENYIHPDGLEALAHASFAATLESLILERNKYWEDATELVDIIVRPNTFKALRVLNLTPNPNNDRIHDSISILAQAPFARQVEELHIASTGKSTEIHTLANTFKSLKRFTLYSTAQVDEEDDTDTMISNGNVIIGILAQTPLAHQLEGLGLPESGVTGQGLILLAQPNTFTSLKSLNLDGNYEIRSGELAALIKAPFADNLELLSLKNIRLAKVDVRSLAHSGKFKNLKSLNLDITHIDSGDLYALAEAPFANTLVNLNLGSALITDLGIQALILPHSFKSLKNLNLSYIPLLTNAGIKTLAQAPFAKNQLETLSVAGTQVENQTIDTLHELGSFFALKRLIDRSEYDNYEDEDDESDEDEGNQD